MTCSAQAYEVMRPVPVIAKASAWACRSAAATSYRKKKCHHFWVLKSLPNKSNKTSFSLSEWCLFAHIIVGNRVDKFQLCWACTADLCWWKKRPFSRPSKMILHFDSKSEMRNLKSYTSEKLWELKDLDLGMFQNPFESASSCGPIG